ncbi:MAG TPA: dTMP kinase [Steroidobacteraceae bacterium]|jgi:dTMP kinase|nr:dTMP kinase [Steroidobacteraceae bacterium]
MRGRFITLEGLEGCGKSTQVPLLKAWLEAQGIAVTATREPGGTPLAERIRELVLGTAGEKMPVECELLLMFAARATHLANLIRPELQKGTWVLCDRFTDASFAYQGAGRGVAETHISALQALVHGDLQPDLTLLIDVPVAVGLERARVRRGTARRDRFEVEEREFFERVRANFLARASTEAKRIKVVDGTQPIASVTAAIQAHVARLIPSE